MSRALFAAVLLSLSTAAFAQSEETEAGDTSEVDKEGVEPLRERIRPVSGHLFLKRGRFELSPSVTVSVKDAFFTKYVFGAAINYHLMEELSIGVRGGYALNTIAGSVRRCNGDICSPPVMADVDGLAPGQISLLGGLEVQWAPIYGKIAVVAENFLHFDLYAVGGAAAVQYHAPRTDGGAGSQAQWTVGGTIGGGGRVFLNRWLTVRLEARDLIYVEDIFPRPATSLRHQIMVELGVSIFFPLNFSER